MILYYYKDKHGNFGDDINGWMWERLLPNAWGETGSVVMSGIGTIIGKGMPEAERVIVFGSGTGYSPPPPSFGKDGWHIVAVRGPLTAKALGLPADAAVTDGAILLALLPEYAPLQPQKRRGAVFMPHHNALEFGLWQQACEMAGVDFINPRDDSKLTMERIRNSALVIADAMHAAIVADALRVPWVPVETSSGINSFKWLDWTASMELEYKPVKMPFSSFLEAAQSALGKALGTGYRLETLTPEAALSHYREAVSKREKLSAPLARRAITLVLKTLRVLSRLPLLSLLAKREDAERLEQAAAMLRELSKTAGFLSEEKVFLSRKEEMRRRLQKVAELRGTLEG